MPPEAPTASRWRVGDAFVILERDACPQLDFAGLLISGIAQSSFEGNVEIAAHLCHALVSVLAEER